MRIADWARRLSPSLAEGGATVPDPGTTKAWLSTVPEARAFLLGTAYLRAPRKTLIVCATYERALAWQAKLELAGVSRERIHQLPGGSSSLFEDGAHEQISESDRL